MEPSTRETRDEQLARELRARIYAGDPAPGEPMPPHASLAARHKMSVAMAQRAIELLAREGLVRGEHGRGTYVCDRHNYRAVVTAEPRGRLPGTRTVADAERGEPAVTDLAVSDEQDRRVWMMIVEAADVAPAAAVAVGVARSAGASGQVAVAVEPA